MKPYTFLFLLSTLLFSAHTTTECYAIPNAFSPNNDGENDVLYVRGSTVTDLHWMVFSRWGEKIFEAKDINTGWDGTFKGEILPTGVYGVVISGKCDDGQHFSARGNVTLLR
jgi:gliding motility-associated-like protein